MTRIVLPIMWDEEQGDLTQDIHSTKPIKKTTGVALFEESENTLSFQNAGNAMNYYLNSTSKCNWGASKGAGL